MSVPTTTDLMEANLFAVFGERDPERRRAAAEQLYADDVRFCDPDDVVVGIPALSAKAQQILDGAPGFVFSAAGPVRVVQDLAQLAWDLGPEGGPSVVSGVDVALVADGRITALYTFLTS